MRPPQDWVKCHKRLATGKWRGVARATRFLFLELALEARPMGGWFELPLGTDDPVEAVVDLFAGRSRKERREVREGMQTLLALGSVQIQNGPEPTTKRVAIPQFASWNSASSSAQRMRAKRERDSAGEQYQVDKSKCDVTAYSECDALEERRGEERRRDPPSGPPKGATNPKGHRLPDDWQPSPELYAYAADPTKPVGYGAADVDRCAEAFRDHWIAATGCNATKRDWNAAFRTWLRKDRERRPQLPRYQPPAEPPPNQAAPDEPIIQLDPRQLSRALVERQPPTGTEDP